MSNIQPAIQRETPSAPELIQDLLVANNTALSVKVICRAGELIDVRASAIRVALNRLVEQGKLSRSARGYYAMNAQISALSRVVDDWKQETVRTVSWDGTWIAIQDSTVLRSDKTEWRHHNLALSLYGFRPFQPGLHLRPNNLIGGVDEVRSRLLELGLSPHCLVFRLDQMDQFNQARALTLWESAALAEEYRAIQQELRISTEQIKKMELGAAVRESLLLGRAVIRKLVRDPLLPLEIAPQEHRLALTAAMKVYHANALALWARWLGTES